MSSNSDTDGPSVPPNPGNRNELLEMLESAMQEAHEKALNGRVYDPENEKVRQGWFRVLGYLAGQHRQVASEAELDELRAELEAIQEQYDLQIDDDQ